MSIEALIYSTLGPLVANRVYPDITPEGITALPRITYAQVGGDRPNFLEAASPNLRNARFQVNVWGATRLQVSGLMRQVEDALKGATALHTTVLGGPVSIYEPDTKLYGARTDFSMWL